MFICVLLPLNKNKSGVIKFFVKFITFLVTLVYCILRQNLLHFELGSFRVTLVYYILRQKLFHFGLLLHFASKVITFWVTITFCANYYILWRNKPFKYR